MSDKGRLTHSPLLRYFAFFLSLLILLTGCSTTEPLNNSSASDSIFTFTDDLGHIVTVESLDRVAVLLGSYADIWILAGGSICACADDAWDDFDLPLDDSVINLGATKKLSYEKLLESDPTFVIASTNSSQHLEWKENLDAAGIPSAYFDVSAFPDYLRMLKICTDLTGHPEIYDQFGTRQEQEIQSLLKRCAGRDPQTVLVLRASASFVRVKDSAGTVLGEMLRDLGCINIADQDQSLLENLSIESIALQNPDKIFILQSGDDEAGTRASIEELFASNPLWGELDAALQQQIFYMDKQLYTFKPNARWAEAYEQLERILYE